MVFRIGSRSAQTPSESSQQSPSTTDRDGRHVAGQLAGLNASQKYVVYHKWRKVGEVAKRLAPHHSQIFVTDLDGTEVVNFGLFNHAGGVVFASDQENPNNPYHTSTSYRPNPVTVTGRKLEQTFNSTVHMRGPEYKLLYNNCQKFARLLMTALGASHDRELFHA